MKRRECVKDLLLAGGALVCRPGVDVADAMPSASNEVKRVLVAFTCHLDVGFTNTQAAVIAKYFDQYYPAAMQTANALREAGDDRYIWSTGSWLLYEYLEYVTGAENRVWLPRVVGCWAGKFGDGMRILTVLQITDAEAEGGDRVAWPKQIYSDLLFPDSEPAAHVNFTCLGKAANRLPEAIWLSFLPMTPEPQGWTLDKVDQPISPFDVLKGGNRHMHAVTRGIYYKDSRRSFSIETLDAPAVALGERSPIYYSNDQPDLAKGFHFSLFNNAWGTNYIQWFGEDTRFRFVLRTT